MVLRFPFPRFQSPESAGLPINPLPGADISQAPAPTITGRGRPMVSTGQLAAAWPMTAARAHTACLLVPRRSTAYNSTQSPAVQVRRTGHPPRSWDDSCTGRGEERKVNAPTNAVSLVNSCSQQMTRSAK